MLRAWGAKQFLMPHMISLDYDGNVWVTGGPPAAPALHLRRCPWRKKLFTPARHLHVPAGQACPWRVCCAPLPAAPVPAQPTRGLRLPPSLPCADVDLHQVFKFTPTGKQLLALGTRGQRGDSATHFCKPTQVGRGPRGRAMQAAAQMRCAAQSGSHRQPPGWPCV